ncbi:MAG: type II toxin-antitoxin system VapC family toxin [Campylobacterales bacterium]|nr:type II toxin-antitoxin system VapC family toxin [Campylobacterales bacterium]
MGMILLDSNIIIYLSKELISIDELFVDSEEYGISVIIYMEVLGYVFESEYERRFIEDFMSCMSCLNIIYINEVIANKVIELKQTISIKLPDAIICATAMINDYILITNDTRLKNINNLNIQIIKL